MSNVIFDDVTTDGHSRKDTFHSAELNCSMKESSSVLGQVKVKEVLYYNHVIYILMCLLFREQRVPLFPIRFPFCLLLYIVIKI